ncbi:MAG: acetate--CoA ligase family protein, partial [Actinomycetota bacterium]|nr:acetate--CoA ligase family protein [Actinomycetota bacterium]
ADASAEDFERALDDAVDDPEIDAVVAVFIPPLNTTGEQVANVLAAVGEQSEKPLLSTFLASEGVPELLRVPDVENPAGRGSVPSYPAPEAAVRALSRVVDYSAWLQRPPGEIAAYEDIDVRHAHRLVNQWLTDRGDGVELDVERVAELLDIYGITLWPRIEVASLDESLAAGSKLGWDVVLKATARHLQQRPDLSHVWRNIDDETEMRDAWHTLNDIIDEPERAAFVVQRMAPPGIPVSMSSMEDPLFGPIVSFGVAGAPSDLLDDRSYRIPPLTDVDAAGMVREIRAAPLLFGYRGSEQVDVACIEELLQRLARLKNDLPEVAFLDLGLVLAGARGCSVLSASCRIAPVRESRSDWFARRLSVPPGDTLPG